MLWEYFQKAGHQTCDDTIFIIELDELLQQYASEVSRERAEEAWNESEIAYLNYKPLSFNEWWIKEQEEL